VREAGIEQFFLEGGITVSSELLSDGHNIPDCFDVVLTCADYDADELTSRFNRVGRNGFHGTAHVIESAQQGRMSRRHIDSTLRANVPALKPVPLEDVEFDAAASEDVARLVQDGLPPLPILDNGTVPGCGRSRNNRASGGRNQKKRSKGSTQSNEGAAFVGDVEPEGADASNPRVYPIGSSGRYYERNDIRVRGQRAWKARKDDPAVVPLSADARTQTTEYWKQAGQVEKEPIAQSSELDPKDKATGPITIFETACDVSPQADLSCEIGSATTTTTHVIGTSKQHDDVGAVALGAEGVATRSGPIMHPALASKAAKVPTLGQSKGAVAQPKPAVAEPKAAIAHPAPAKDSSKASANPPPLSKTSISASVDDYLSRTFGTPGVPRGPIKSSTASSSSPSRASDAKTTSNVVPSKSSAANTSAPRLNNFERQNKSSATTASSGTAKPAELSPALAAAIDSDDPFGTTDTGYNPNARPFVATTRVNRNAAVKPREKKLTQEMDEGVESSSDNDNPC
jgi:hypothetical protein